MRWWARSSLAVLGLPVAAAACGRLPLILDGGSTDVVIDAAAADVAIDAAGPPDGAASRVPRHHRATGEVCPRDRGPSGLPPDLAAKCAADPTFAPFVGCLGDADCAAGANGECVRGPGIACLLGCSYDQCFDDSNCPSPAPCGCRASAASPAANRCQINSDCRTDADCGPGGFCSPSLLDALCVCPSPALCTPGSGTCTAGGMEVPCACGDACGHGYFCHTKDDACVDDADCGTGTCSYDRVTHTWHCAICLPVP